MLRTKKLIVGSLLFIVACVLAGELALAGKPVPPPPLPPVRYRIKYPQLPANYNPDMYLTVEGITSPFFLNNKWQVQAVGAYMDLDGRYTAFLYDPAVDPNKAIDLNSWFDGNRGVPEGYYLRSARDINDENVIIGQLEDQAGNRCGFAIDLAAETPVVDLLPTVDGATDLRPTEINENGDILVIYQDASGTWRSYLFNPGYYGDPEHRIPRDGTPLDFRDVDVSDLILPLSGSSVFFHLNNPYQGRPAQIAGVAVDELAFRYTVGAAEPERFPIQAYQIGAINDDGAFCGEKVTPLKGGKYAYQPFRYDDINGTQLLPTDATRSRFPNDMNRDRDLLTTRSEVYRDDWSGWVALDTLLVGTSTDVALWNSDSRHFLLWPCLSDRIEVMNAAGVRQRAGIIAGGRTNRLVVLTPEVWPQ